MRGILFLVLLVAPVTTFLQHNHNVAAAGSRERNSASLNVSYGCVGLHCLAANNIEADLFIDEDGLMGMLAASHDPVTDGSKNPNHPGPDCKAVHLYGGSDCLGSRKIQNGQCSPRNRNYPYCQ